jgi:hypothetical protein
VRVYVLCAELLDKFWLTVLCILWHETRLLTCTFQLFTSPPVPGDLGKLGTHIYVVTLETPRVVEAKNTSCTQLLWKPRDPGGQGTLIYVITMETWRMYVSVCYNFAVEPAVNVKTRIMCAYIYIYIILLYFYPEALYVVKVETSISRIYYIPSALPSDLILCLVFSCHLVPVHETPMRECDRDWLLQCI